MIKKNIIIAIYLTQISATAFAIEPLEAISEANEAIIQGDLDRAKVVLEGAISESPDSLSLYNALGRVFTLSGNLNEAERVLKTGIIEHSNASNLFDNLLKVNELRVSERYRRALGIKEDESVNHVLKVTEAWGFSPEVMKNSSTVGTIAANTVSIPDEESVAIVPNEGEQPNEVASTDIPSNEVVIDGVVSAADLVVATVDTNSSPETVEGVIGGTEEELNAVDQGIEKPDVTDEIDETVVINETATEEEPENSGNEGEEGAESEALVAVKPIIEKWRTAWSNRDADSYVKTYTADYSPSDDMSHDNWVNDRKQNFSSKSSIEVTVSDLEANLIGNNRIRVRFSQRYKSNNYEDQVVKRITLLKSGDEWLIDQEISSPVD